MIGLNEFPSLHPLVIHFPIVLLIIVVFFQISAILMKQKLLDIIIIYLLIGGFIGALVASTILHPHLKGLDTQIQNTLINHEFFAYSTIWISGTALILKALNYYVFNKAFWIELLVSILILGCSVSVSIAGHYGAQLVYIEGIGPKGNQLDIRK